MTFGRQAIEAKKLGERILERDLRERFTGIGLKNSPELVVWVERPEDALRVPPQINGLPTVVKITGELWTLPKRFATRAQSVVYDDNYEYVRPTATSAANKQKVIRPVVGGISIGPPASGGFVTSGTGGLICYDVKTGAAMMLTNFHVAFFNRDNADGKGNAIYQPALSDGGDRTEDRIGYTHKWVKYKLIDDEDNSNHMDACIVAIDSGIEYTAEILDIGAINTLPGDPAVGAVVRKGGRNCYLEGEITAIGQTMFVNDSIAGRLKFENVVVAEPGSLMISGDSGSVWTSKPGSGNPKVLALGFAGGDAHALATPIKPIMNTLGITFSPDSVLPKVNITYPRDVQTVYAGRIRYKGTASDDKGLDNVAIRIDLFGNQIGDYFETVSADGFRTWYRDITIRTIGTHKVVARATDKAGNQKWHVIFITVRASPYPTDETPDSDPPGSTPIKSAGLAAVGIGAGVVGAISLGWYGHKKGWFG